MRPVLSDTEGVISELLIFIDLTETGIEKGHYPLERSLLAYFLKEPDVKCWVKSRRQYDAEIDIGGILDSTANRISFDVPNSITKHYVQAGFNSSEDLLLWLSAHLPFSDNFSIVLSANGIERLASYEVRKKISRGIELCQQFSDMVVCDSAVVGTFFWEGTSAFGTTITVVEGHSNLMIPFGSQSPDYGLLLTLLQEFNDFVALDILDWDRRLNIDDQQLLQIRGINPYCAGKWLHPYPQDQFIVRGIPGEKASIALIEKKLTPNQIIEVRNYVRNMLPNVSVSDSVDDLPVTGGNMQVSGAIAFVGMDDLNHFQSIPENGQIASTSVATDALLPMIFENRLDKHLIWLGTRNLRSWGSQSGYQPVFHIDMFFCPLGMRQSEDGKINFHYLFAKPSPEYLFNIDSDVPVYLDITDLIIWFDATQQLLNEDLRVAGYNPQPVDLPFPLGCQGNSIKRYYAFCNGLVNTYPDGRVRYHMPVFVAPKYGGDRFSGFQLQAYNDINAISHIEAVKIEGAKEYGNPIDSALRCNVKVLSRK